MIGGRTEFTILCFLAHATARNNSHQNEMANSAGCVKEMQIVTPQQS